MATRRKSNRKLTINLKAIINSTPVICNGNSAVVHTRADGSTEITCPNHTCRGECSFKPEVHVEYSNGCQSGIYQFFNHSTVTYHPCHHKI